MEQDFSKMPSEISGGMQKRVGLAARLRWIPSFCCSMNYRRARPHYASEIAGLSCTQGAEKAGAIVVTHDIHSARVFADRLVLLQEGSILAQGRFDESSKAKIPFVMNFLKQGVRD